MINGKNVVRYHDSVTGALFTVRNLIIFNWRSLQITLSNTTACRHVYIASLKNPTTEGFVPFSRRKKSLLVPAKARFTQIQIYKYFDVAPRTCRNVVDFRRCVPNECLTAATKSESLGFKIYLKKKKLIE